MSLKISRRQGSENYYITGSVAGRRVRTSAGTTCKETAEAEAARLERSLWKRRIYGDAAITTFAQAVNLYIEAGGETKYLLPLAEYFGVTPLIEITPQSIRIAAPKLYPNVKPATWNRQVIVPARAVINCAHQAGLCPHLQIKGFKSAPVERKAVNREWIDQFRQHASTDYLKALALIMFQTGLRIGEVLALEPSDVDLEARRATIQNTKNNRRHSVFLTDELVDELADLPPRGGRVFGYKTPYSIYGQWATTCRRAGIEYVPPHQAGRHSFATELIVRNGVDIPTVAALGNWRSTALLTDTYCHPEKLEQTIDQVFGNQQQ